MEQTKWALVATDSQKSGSEDGAGLYSSVVFQALLRHERSRSDRDGSQFSLVVFDVSSMAADERNLRHAARHIRRNMRSIDEIGWVEERSIGVLLPVTSLTGGNTFAERLSLSIPWTSYSYPTHWFPGGNGDSGNGSRKIEDSESIGCRFEDIFGNAFGCRIPAWKRCMDIAGALAALAILFPIITLVSLYIKCVSPGTVLFRQKRVGYKGRPFTFLKFRTMHPNNDPTLHREYLKELIKGGQPMEKLDGGRDPRIIPGGKILRKVCIDELPQLINVLRGEMSLVGPRPCIPYEAEEYLRWHVHRFDILPGMTGLWQVSGKNRLSFEQMVRLDISYMKRMSLLLDLMILLRTVPTILGMVFEAIFRTLGLRQGEATELHLARLESEESAPHA